MNYTDKVIKQSNSCYNDGLRRAAIRDMSGAIVALRRSLQYCQKNIAARNLLGLVYYGRGEVNEALVEWIISKNLKPKDNVANYFIRKVQESSEELEQMNACIKKYNQSLVYCQQDSEDMALIQLRKVLSRHRTFVKAHQLAALLYIRKKQYSKARVVLLRAQKIDTTNPDTLYYLNELPAPKKKKKQDVETNDPVSYKVGNDTIIQPTSITLKENASTVTLVNVITGVVIGAALVGFLFVPAMRQNENMANANAVRVYSQEIDAQKAQINALTTELSNYRTDSETMEALTISSTKSKESYEYLMEALDMKEDGKSTKSIIEKLIQVESSSLGEEGASRYNDLYKEIVPTYLESRYEIAEAKFKVKDNDSTINELEFIVSVDPSYAEYNAMLMLAQTYEGIKDTEMADKYYDIIVKDGENTKAAETVREEKVIEEENIDQLEEENE